MLPLLLLLLVVAVVRPAWRLMTLQPQRHSSSRSSWKLSVSSRSHSSVKLQQRWSQQQQQVTL
jgi:hypothetical protein